MRSRSTNSPSLRPERSASATPVGDTITARLRNKASAKAASQKLPRNTLRHRCKDHDTGNATNAAHRVLRIGFLVGNPRSPAHGQDVTPGCRRSVAIAALLRGAALCSSLPPRRIRVGCRAGVEPSAIAARPGAVTGEQLHHVLDPCAESLPPDRSARWPRQMTTRSFDGAITSARTITVARR